MAQQTAVEWLIANLPERFKNAILNSCKDLIEESKQMEREQLNVARLDGINLANKGYGKSEDKTFKRKSLWTKVENKQQ